MPPLWDRVAELIGRAPSWDALRVHRLHLMAARLGVSRGAQIPDDVRRDRRAAAVLAWAAPSLLERARSAYDGGLMLMKGPEVAARYPHPSDRYFRDLDLLADDAVAAQHALIDAGFVELGDPSGYAGRQHLCPLAWPDLPLVLELHHRPSVPAWLPCPSSAAVFERGSPSAMGIDGLLAPEPGAHALILAAHSWSHQPLGRLTDLIDVVAALGSQPRTQTMELARSWGWEGLWQTTIGAADSVLADAPPGAAMRLWTRHLPAARDLSVVEDHFLRIAARASTVPRRRVPAAVVGAVLATAARREDEPWRVKLRRSRLAFSHAFMGRGEHNRVVANVKD